MIIGYDDLGTGSTLDDVLIMADPYDTCDHKQDGYAVNNGEKFYSIVVRSFNAAERTGRAAVHYSFPVKII